jgi:dephospho-CoA kinase
MVLRIGLTGGIGSGKTIVCKIFEKLGVPVYYADAAAKQIMNEDPVVKKQIIQLFGQEAYSNNALNRPYISSVVFKNREMLGALNAIVHPATISASDRWMQSQTTPYAIKEAALIFESGIPQALDYIIGVTAPLALRVQRVMLRDGLKEEEVLGRMKNQMDEEEKMKLCDFVIINDEQLPVIPQVLHIHNHINGIFQQNMGT